MAKRELTVTEKEFYGYLKKELFFTGVKIKTKISVEELCAERNDIPFAFGNDAELVRSILIDFVLYKKGKALAGIEIIDEIEEFENNKGEKMLKDLLFNTMGYEYFRIVDLTRLNEAAKIVKEKTLKLLNE